jgi:large subunit ribosomal protein L6
VSRIGKLPVPLPKGVKVTREKEILVVEGPKGRNEERIHRNMILDFTETEITVRRPDDSKFNRSLHGLTRTLIMNAVTGVTTGFVKKLVIEGVGYRAALSGKTQGGLTLDLGYSHQIEIAPPEGVKFEVPAQTQIVVNGINKQVVGEIAAQIRGCRPPEPYKGKGIRYEGEQILRKAGKAGSAK